MNFTFWHLKNVFPFLGNVVLLRMSVFIHSDPQGGDGDLCNPYYKYIPNVANQVVPKVRIETNWGATVEFQSFAPVNLSFAIKSARYKSNESNSCPAIDSMKQKIYYFILLQRSLSCHGEEACMCMRSWDLNPLSYTPGMVSPRWEGQGRGSWQSTAQEEDLSGKTGGGWGLASSGKPQWLRRQNKAAAGKDSKNSGAHTIDTWPCLSQARSGGCPFTSDPRLIDAPHRHPSGGTIKSVAPGMCSPAIWRPHLKDPPGELSNTSFDDHKRWWWWWTFHDAEGPGFFFYNCPTMVGNWVKLKGKREMCVKAELK